MQLRRLALFEVPLLSLLRPLSLVPQWLQWLLPVPLRLLRVLRAFLLLRLLLLLLRVRLVLGGG
jgi:hypothetical protein